MYVFKNVCYRTMQQAAHRGASGIGEDGRAHVADKAYTMVGEDRPVAFAQLFPRVQRVVRTALAGSSPAGQADEPGDHRHPPPRRPHVRCDRSGGGHLPIGSP